MRKENILSKPKKVKSATVNVVDTEQAKNYMVRKLTNCLKKFDKRLTCMESRFDALNMRQNSIWNHKTCISEPRGCYARFVNRMAYVLNSIVSSVGMRVTSVKKGN